MKCEKCGNKLLARQTRCPQCGELLAWHRYTYSTSGYGQPYLSLIVFIVALLLCIGILVVCYTVSVQKTPEEVNYIMLDTSKHTTLEGYESVE